MSDFSTARELMEKKRYLEDQRAMMANNIAGNAFGMNMAAAAQSARSMGLLGGIAQAPAPKKTGVLYTANGELLADDWRGAVITDFAKRYTNGRYEITFTSKWAGDAILLYVDAQEHSGAAADKIAETYKEALNQRRLG